MPAMVIHTIRLEKRDINAARVGGSSPHAKNECTQVIMMLFSNFRCNTVQSNWGIELDVMKEKVRT